MLQGLVTVVCLVLHIRISSADTNPGDGKQLSLSFFFPSFFHSLFQGRTSPFTMQLLFFS